MTYDEGIPLRPSGRLEFPVPAYVPNLGIEENAKVEEGDDMKGTKWPSELKMTDGWHYATGRWEDGKPVWSAESHRTRDAARSASREAKRKDDEPDTEANPVSVEPEPADRVQKVVDTAIEGDVSLEEMNEAGNPAALSSEPTKQEDRTMTITLKGLSKNGKRAIYQGAAQLFHIPVGAFPSKQPPASFDVADGTFAAPKAASAPKVKETKEERKARLAALPKPTLAERIAKREAQLAKDKAKLAAASQM